MPGNYEPQPMPTSPGSVATGSLGAAGNTGASTHSKASTLEKTKKQKHGGFSPVGAVIGVPDRAVKSSLGLTDRTTKAGLGVTGKTTKEFFKAIF